MRHNTPVSDKLRIRIAQYPITLICDAVVDHLGPQRISTSNWGYDWQSHRIKHNDLEVFFLTVCYLGNLSAVEYCLSLRKSTKIEEEEEEEGITNTTAEEGLLMAASAGHKEVAEYLLRIGISPNPSGLAAATRSGKLTIIKMFLGVRYPKGARTSPCGDAMTEAVELPDPNTRMEVIRFLHDSAGDTISDRWAWTDILAKACQMNDMKLAKWIISRGHLNLYAKDDVPGSRGHPLMAAVLDGRIEAVRLILNTEFEIECQWNHLRIQLRAMKMAILQNLLEIFMEFIPHMLHRDPILSPGYMIQQAAAVEGGLDAVDKLLGPFDLTQQEPPKTGEPEILGERLLKKAIRRKKVQNIKWLLSRGVKTNEEIPMDLGSAAIDANKRI